MGPGISNYEVAKCLQYENERRLAIHQSIDPAVASIDFCRMEVAGSTLNISCIPQAVADGAVTDEMMLEAISVHEDVLLRYKAVENTRSAHYILTRLSCLVWQRYYNFKSVSPIAALPYLTEADAIYCETRRERSISKPSTSLGAKQNLAETYKHNLVYNDAFKITLEMYVAWKPGQHSMVNIQTCAGDSLDEHLLDFLEWTQKSKARGLTDALGLEARLPSRMLAEAKQSSEVSILMEKETQLVSRINNVGFEEKIRLRLDLRQLREAMRSEPALDQIMRIRDGSSMTLTEIQMLGTELGPDVVFVDWIHVVWRDSANLLIVLYRDGCFQQEEFLTLKLEDVESWVHDQLDVARPLRDSGATSNLDAMAGLIEPLERYTHPGDMLVLCPTRILHRVPLHAIKLGDRPLISRNPVVYTQSLSILRLCTMSLNNDPPPSPSETSSSVTPPSFRTVTVHPLPDSWCSIDTVKELTTNLSATSLHGSRIDKSSFFETAANASLIHYHGHISSNSDPLRRAIILDSTSPDISEKTSVTVDEIFDLHLARPALITLMGCSSNHAPINPTDDLRSIPNAFHYAGATSVVSTLWPILDVDGAKFSQLFYTELGCQLEEHEVDEGSVGLQKWTLDLAKAIQKAVKVMMTNADGKELAAHHWAGYILNGVWKWQVPRGALAHL
jgi:CHAT domain-containing protein